MCHTEFGYVYDKQVIFDKEHTSGAKEGVSNLIKVADGYGAKVTFAVMPEVVEHFPRKIKHEIGLHIHPGWVGAKYKDVKWYVGDTYLREHCKQSTNSSVLRDYSYKEQLDMIKTGKDHLSTFFGIEPTVFVAGRWSINNDTVKALIKTGITHDCSAPAHAKPCHHDWSKLPRICMPYHPSKTDYQEKGDLPLLIVPISQMLIGGNVNPEVVSLFGLSWLKACFLEYYKQDLPLFHICLHSPIMTNRYFIKAIDNFLSFISKHKNINFKFASGIEECDSIKPKEDILPYLLGVNRDIMKIGLKSINSRIFSGSK